MGSMRMVFLGDSITFTPGQYIEYLEAYLRLKDPTLRTEFLDLGLPERAGLGPERAGARSADKFLSP